MNGGVVRFTWQAVPLNAKQRKELAGLITSAGAKRVSAHVLITDSRPVQMVLKVMDWFVRKPYPEEVFMEPGAALDWIQRHVPLDRTALVNAVLQKVPAGQRDPAFEYLTRTQADRVDGVQVCSGRPFSSTFWFPTQSFTVRNTNLYVFKGDILFDNFSVATGSP